MSIALIHDGRPPPPPPSSPLSLSASHDSAGSGSNRSSNSNSSRNGKDELIGRVRPTSPQAVSDLGKINPHGYSTVIKVIVPYLIQLLSDSDLDTRRCASDSLSSLCARLKPDDVKVVIDAATALAVTAPSEEGESSKSLRKKKKAAAAAAAAAGGGSAGGAAANAGPTPEDLRTVASNLLAEIASLSNNDINSVALSSSSRSSGSSVTPALVSSTILPPILRLCSDSHFRVRRAAVQSLPRVMAGGTVSDAADFVLPIFAKLSTDDMYRVRKSVGECLVDMSRSIMLLSDGRAESEREKLLALRRDGLVPICTRLLDDPNKFVRHGMQQFLGPFIASFYPLGPRRSSEDDEEGDDAGRQGGGVMSLLESNATDHHGSGQLSILGARFFPHAAGMVGRLNPGSAAAEAAEAAALSGEKEKREAEARRLQENEEDRLLRLLPPFLVLSRSDQATLRAIVAHREMHPPHPEDLVAVRTHLLPPFVALAEYDSSDENLDAEMRVYCAYSLPGVILLMGKESWTTMDDEEQLLRKCFLSLSTGMTALATPADDVSSPSLEPAPVPLPVKRCLASSFHTICCILGQDILTAPGDGPLRPGLLHVFEHYFLRDPDDTVRLNVMRTLPSLLSLLDPASRSKFLPTLHSIVVGDAVLGAPVRRSATNPHLLNWRQRDAVSQILPDLVLLYGPIEVRKYLWPVLKMLLADKVNAVRDDVEFCIPTVLRSYAPENVKEANVGADGERVDPRRFSAEACAEVVAYLKETLLENGTTASNNGSYSRRQMYCRTCAALAVAIRLGKSNADDDIKQSPSDEDTSVSGQRSRHPYESYTPTEYKHMHTLLVDSFLPDALNMREDRVSNVRLTLVAALKVMPDDILEKKETQTILRTLEEEMRTWDSGFGIEPSGVDGTSGPTASVSTVTRSTAPNSSVSSSSSSSAQQAPSRGRDKSSSKRSSRRDHPNEDKPETSSRRGKFDRSSGSRKNVEDEKTGDKIVKQQQDQQAGDDDDDDNHSLSSI